MDDQPLIEVDGLSRYYGPHRAVEGVSFEVRRGEVLGFLGPNGAGKTTTMQVLTGNLAPSRGRVCIDGADILDQPLKAKAAIGYLPERPPLYLDQTVREYLRYAARLNRVPRKQMAAAVDRAMQRCGLADMGSRLIANLSKGFQQRVGIAQAVIHNPPAVVLDEPTVGLDPLQVREIRELIRDLSAEHAVILSTHILPEVQAVCDRVQIIHRGTLALSASIAGLRRRAGSARLVVGLRRPPATAELEAIPGVTRVTPLDAGRWQLDQEIPSEQDLGRDDDGVATAELVAQYAVEQGWGLYELVPQTLNLEQLFVEITTADATGRPSADDGQRP